MVKTKMRRVQSAAERALHNQEDILPRGKLLLVFATLSLTLLMCFIDQNGISVALPTIARDLGAEATISWAGTSSLIANTTFQMLYGRLSDIFGRKRVYLAATGLLCIADLLCGLARSPAMFYVFRGVAGIAGGGITSLSMIIVSDIVTLEQRGKYQGIIGACVGLGNVAGPFLAAAFISKVSWRVFFYMLSPLSALGGIVSFFLLPSNAPPDGVWENVKKIDYGGVLASSIAVILVLIPVSGGGAYFEWKSPMVISMLIIGGLSFVVFLLIEWRFAKLPMMPVQIFQNHVVTVLLIQTFFFGSVYQANLYYLPLYLQNVKQYSVVVSAAIAISMSVAQSTLSILSGQYISRTKRYGEVLWAGFGVWTLGAGLTLLYGRATHPVVIVLPLVVIGMGTGNVFQPTLVALQAHSPKPRRAVIISNRNFFRCAGGSCGLAVSAAVLQAALRANLSPEYSYLANKTYSLPHIEGPGKDAILDAYMAASRAVFILQIPLVGLAFLGCIFVKDRGLDYIDSTKEKEGPAADESRQGQEESSQDEEADDIHDKAEEGSAGDRKKAKERQDMFSSVPLDRMHTLE